MTYDLVTCWAPVWRLRLGRPTARDDHRSGDPTVRRRTADLRVRPFLTWGRRPSRRDLGARLRSGSWVGLLLHRVRGAAGDHEHDPDRDEHPPQPEEDRQQDRRG